MNRKETTEFLSNLLIERLSGRGKYYASEVTLDCGGGKGETKRVDFMNNINGSDIEVIDNIHDNPKALRCKNNLKG